MHHRSLATPQGCWPCTPELCSIPAPEPPTLRAKPRSPAALAPALTQAPFQVQPHLGAAHGPFVQLHCGPGRAAHAGKHPLPEGQDLRGACIRAGDSFR